MKHLLEADSIVLEFGLRRILSDIYIRCDTGNITGLLGRNGQGKSCLMNIIYGNLPALNKSVRFDRLPVPYAFKKPGLLTYLPQFNFIPGRLTVKQVFADFKLDFSHFDNLFPGFDSTYKIAFKNFSGGDRRLIETYVMILSDAQFTMLDEPFSHLSPVHTEKMKIILKEIKARKGLLITDHQYEQITDICDHLYLLADGKTHLIKDSSDLSRLGYISI
jgi:lipopolysaccharide export system ATP-binding protein